MRDVKKHRIRLYIESNGLCNYCGVKTEFPKGEANDGTPTLATIDHVYSRFNPYRWTPNSSNEKRHVLSCFKCNQMRARLEEITQFLIDETFYLEETPTRIVQRKKSELMKV
jgi:5-methylcytosine-specific restriction endonuclease McrA